MAVTTTSGRIGWGVRMTTFAINPSRSKWVSLPSHRSWLLKQAEELFCFFENRIVNPLGGFIDLDDEGKPTVPGYGRGGAPARYLFATTRIVHAFSIAHLMGRPGADAIVDHGMNFLWNGHRDPEHGGYYWAVGYDGPTDSSKQAYGHAFVLLAASSATVAGHPDARRLLADISTVISGPILRTSDSAPSPKNSRATGAPSAPIADRTLICI